MAYFASMPTLDRSRSVLCLIDFQERLVPAIDGGGDVVANAARLLAAAETLGVPVVMTEQNPKGLGGTVQTTEGYTGPSFDPVQKTPGSRRDERIA